MFSILQKLFPPIWWHCLLIHFQYFICYVIYFLDTWNQSKQKQIWFLHFIFCGSGHKLMSNFSIFWSSKIQRFSVISDDWTFVQTLTKGKAFLTSVIKRFSHLLFVQCKTISHTYAFLCAVQNYLFSKVIEFWIETWIKHIPISQIDQGEAGATESKLRLCKVQKNFWFGSLASKKHFGRAIFHWLWAKRRSH